MRNYEILSTSENGYTFVKRHTCLLFIPSMKHVVSFISHPGSGSSLLASGSGIRCTRSAVSAAAAASPSNHAAATATMLAHHSITGSQQPGRKLDFGIVTQGVGKWCKPKGSDIARHSEQLWVYDFWNFVKKSHLCIDILRPSHSPNPSSFVFIRS